MLDLFEERFQAVNATVNRLAEATSDLGTRLSERARETNDAVSMSHGDVPRADAKRLVNKAADDMGQYVKRAGVEIPLLREALAEGISAMGKAATLVVDLDQDDLQKTGEAREAVSQFEASLTEAKDGLAQMMATVQRLPRMTTMLNKARAATIRTLEEITQVLAGGERDASEARKALDLLLQKRPPPAPPNKA